MKAEHHFRIRGATMNPRVTRHEVVQPSDTTIRLIPLTQGQNAIVDADDYSWLITDHVWFAHWEPHREEFRAVTNGGAIHMSRMILGLQKGDRRVADHINGNTLDNRRSNLRVANYSQNAANMRTHRQNRSGFKGVVWHEKNRTWVSYIRIDGKNVNLGSFSTPQAAHAAYCTAADRAFGEFAYVNRGNK